MNRLVITLYDFDQNINFKILTPMVIHEGQEVVVENLSVNMEELSYVFNGYLYSYPANLIKVTFNKNKIITTSLMEAMTYFNFNFSNHKVSVESIKLSIKEEDVFKCIYIAEAAKVHCNSILQGSGIQDHVKEMLAKNKRTIISKACDAYTIYLNKLSQFYPDFNYYYLKQTENESIEVLNTYFKEALIILTGQKTYEDASIWALVNKNGI